MNVTVVQEWLDHVAADLDAAWSCARGPRARTDRAAYFVQQAAEKLVKAVLVSSSIDPPYTHDLEDLTSRLPQDVPQRERYAALVAFTAYASGFRYPTTREHPPRPSTADVDGWIEQIDVLKSEFERWLEAAADPQGSSAP
jgi:HEPN domain-containing protein